MELLTEKSSAAFLKRFVNCEDGVILRLEVAYRFGEVPATASIITSALDQSDPASPYQRCALHFILTGAEEFRFSESFSQSMQVLSPYGLTIGFFNTLTFLSFGEEPEGLQTADDFRKSSFYIACQQCEWELLPISDYIK